MTPSQLRTLTVACGVLALLGGCSTPTNYVVVPEEEPSVAPVQPPAPRSPERYTVKPGDSLYLISFATGTDWREIARLNGINAPYKIFPGQSLLVRQGSPATVQRPGAPSGGVITRAAPSATPVTAQPIPLPMPSPGVASATSRPPAAAPARSAAPVDATPRGVPAPRSGTSAPPPAAVAAASAVPPSPPRPAAAAPAAQRPPRPGAWQWPATGKLIGHFSGGAQPHKGIDLDGRVGDPVRAANSGVVVYAGSGVRGYGNLLIVKHDDVFLSAYAHNSKLLVKEGDVVRAGQTIAQIGDSGTDRVKLHFEVRRKGTPVDPAKVLPRR